MATQLADRMYTLWAYDACVPSIQARSLDCSRCPGQRFQHKDASNSRLANATNKVLQETDSKPSESAVDSTGDLSDASDLETFSEASKGLACPVENLIEHCPTVKGPLPVCHRGGPFLRQRRRGC